MPRRERRLGVKFIENERERDITFFKRRAGLFKGAADLSALTGASIAVVLETSNGKMHSFGTPSADPIVDTVISGVAPTDPFADHATKDRIALLQSAVAQLESKNAMEEKRAKLSIQRVKEAQDQSSGTASKHVFSKEEELNLEELNELLCGLSRVQKDIRHRLPPLRRGPELGSGGPRAPWYALPPRSSWAQSLPLPQPLQSSWSHLLPRQPPSWFPLASAPQYTPAQLSPLQVPPMEAQPYSYGMRGLEISGNGAPPSLQYASLPSMPVSTSLIQPLPNQGQQLPSPLQLSSQSYANPYNLMEAPQSYPSSTSTFQYNKEDPPLLPYDSGNEFSISDQHSYDMWDYSVSN